MSYRIGAIDAMPGTKSSGFLPVEGLDMPDGSGNLWNIPVIIVNGIDKGPVFEVERVCMEKNSWEPTQC